MLRVDGLDACIFGLIDCIGTASCINRFLRFVSFCYNALFLSLLFSISQ